MRGNGGAGARNSASIGIVIAGAWLTISRPAAAQGDTVDHDMKQAMLYLDAQAPQRAVKVLEPDVAAEPGKSNPLLWLLLARAYTGSFDLDRAGEAVTRAESLNVEPRLRDNQWAADFYKDFTTNYGGFQIVEAKCPDVVFPVKLAAPTTAEKQKILEGVAGWTQRQFLRSTAKPFYLPTASYSFGSENQFGVLAGKVVKINVGQTGANCANLIPTGKQDVQVAGQGGDEGNSVFNEDTMPWLLGGAGVVVLAVGGIVLGSYLLRGQAYDAHFDGK